MKYKKSPIIAIINVTLKLFNICVMYGICSRTTKEVSVPKAYPKDCYQSRMGADFRYPFPSPFQVPLSSPDGKY